MILGGNQSSRALSLGGIVILVLIEISVVRSRPDSLAANLAATGVAVVAWLVLMSPLSQAEPLVRAVSVAALGAASIGLVLASANGAGIIPAIVAIVASTRVKSPYGPLLAAALILAYVAATAVALGRDPIAILSYALGLTFAYLAARSTTQLRDEQARTKALLVEVQQNRDAQVEAAALNERARIAREIHDVLAHTLAALTVQLEGARVSLEQRGSDPQALAAVERAHHLAREGLNETRRAVSALRGDEIPGTDRLQALVDDFQKDTGTSATLRIEGPMRQLAAEAQLAIFRTAQEALTNVRKHAGANRVELILRYEPALTELLVADHGRRTSDDVAAGGYGLLGMRERAELLGGTLDAHPTEDGFIVTLRIPG